MPSPSTRRLPVGAEVQSANGGVHFRIWAPASRKVAVLLGERVDLADAHAVPLEAERGGYWSGRIVEARAGMHYRYALERGAFPDLASRFQPEGPHGASQIVDPAAFAWTDDGWRGVTARGQSIYELHIGTFTREGTWHAAIERLPHLAELGVTLLEVMPVADFPGRFGWGYDGVNLFAPTRLYGTPDDFRRFVDRAHALGLGVILDVVYNHLGPDGNYAGEFSSHYASRRYHTEWGAALNFDGWRSRPVRELFLSNAAYWIDEFHCDGLRLDATHRIFDGSRRHLLAELATHARAAARGRTIYLVSESEPQDAGLARLPERGGCGHDALWNDDFHHAAIVALTGNRAGYFRTCHGEPQEFVSMAKRGFLHGGRRRRTQRDSDGLMPWNFVNFLQNHDQIANALWGRRFHSLTSAGRMRALTALLLLGPQTPMLFQGQEFAASAPFVYFADHQPALATAVAKGRAKMLARFPRIVAEDVAALIPHPEREETFLRCKLDFAERERNAEVWRLHCDLLRLRRDDPVIGKTARDAIDGAVIDGAAFILRYFSEAHGDRLLAVNLGAALPLDAASEPLLVPPAGRAWQVVWSSEDSRYGGSGNAPSAIGEGWTIPEEAALLLRLAAPQDNLRSA